MSQDSMLMCLIAFVLGFLVARMTSGNGLMVGGQGQLIHCPGGQDDCRPYGKDCVFSPICINR